MPCSSACSNMAENLRYQRKRCHLVFGLHVKKRTKNVFFVIAWRHRTQPPSQAGVVGFKLGSGSPVWFCWSLWQREIKLRRHQFPTAGGVSGVYRAHDYAELVLNTRPRRAELASTRPSTETSGLVSHGAIFLRPAPLRPWLFSTAEARTNNSSSPAGQKGAYGGGHRRTTARPGQGQGARARVLRRGRRGRPRQAAGRRRRKLRARRRGGGALAIPCA